MHLRLSVLSLKIKISRLLNLGFSLFMIFACQSIVEQLLFPILGIHLGFLVWVIVAIFVGISISVHGSLSQHMSDSDDKFYDLAEFTNEMAQTGDIEGVLKLKRFLNSLHDVFNRAKIGPSHLPRVFVTRPSTKPNLTEAQKQALTFNVYHTGLGRGKVISASFESVMYDDLTQDQMSYVLAHELGHSQAQAMFHMSLATGISRTVKMILKWFFVAAIITGIATGTWTLLTSIIGLFLFDTLLTNLVARLEEFYADSYACSLGFGNGGEKLFRYMEQKKIGIIPSVVEIFVNHPTHQNRLTNLKAISNNDQGIIPDVLEKWFYAFLALGLGFFIYSMAAPGYILLAVLLYLGSIGSFITLCNSEILPKTFFYYVLRSFNFLVALITVYVAGGFMAIPTAVLWFVYGSVAFVYVESLFNHSSDFLNALGGYLETLIFFFQLLVLFQVLGLISLPLPRLL